MRVVTLLISYSLFACADVPADFGEVSSGVVTDNRLAGNTLSQNRLAGNRLAGNRLAGNTLANNSLALADSAGDLLATADGREVLSFIVSCALDENTTVVGEFVDEHGDPQTLEFFGHLGLAPRWLKQPLDRKGKGWVSACLFARVNATGIALPISLRGPHHRLTADAAERAQWSLEEGAFYGNWFTDDDEIDWNACRGRDQAAGEIGGLVNRDCAEPDGTTGLTQCGFNYAGDCGSFAERYACKRFDENGTFYTKCHDDDVYKRRKHHHKKGNHHDDDDDDHGNHGGWGHSDHRAYRQVITVYAEGP